jgi:hypothetical protein
VPPAGQLIHLKAAIAHCFMNFTWWLLNLGSPPTCVSKLGNHHFQRIHGRGGRAVTAAELLSVATFLEQRHAQAFPSWLRAHRRAGGVVLPHDNKKSGYRNRSQPDALIVRTDAIQGDRRLPGPETDRLSAGQQQSQRGRSPPRWVAEQLDGTSHRSGIRARARHVDAASQRCCGAFIPSLALSI